ncbi:hypothetical protein J6590_025439, partial [Homalodisca vitripennis]
MQLLDSSSLEFQFLGVPEERRRRRRCCNSRVTWAYLLSRLVILILQVLPEYTSSLSVLFKN